MLIARVVALCEVVEVPQSDKSSLFYGSGEAIETTVDHQALGGEGHAEVVVEGTDMFHVHQYTSWVTVL